MRSVMISIKPYWVFLIIVKTMGWNVDEEKTIEVRKSFPKDEDWNKVVKIYCTKDKQSFARILKEYQPCMERFLGRVIGEFVCDKIYSIQYRIPDSPNCLFSETASCLKSEDFIAYGKGKPLYGWHISNPVIYDKPKELSKFGMARPFQSWGYVEEIESGSSLKKEV